ncbi:MAG: hypothetical protein U1E51_07890 [Candidatus Binatia bacterium]|nr:hypothetical protein [Candidatus Binatia bacterium]
MKSIQMLFVALLAMVAGFSARAQACWGEFGAQDTWPAVTAAVDLSGYQYRVVRFSAAQACNVASHALSAAPTEIPCGILQNKPKSGEAATVAYAGPSKAMAGATVTARALISTNGSGQVIDAVSGSIVIGRAQETGAVSEIISVVLMPPVRWGSVA